MLHFTLNQTTIWDFEQTLSSALLEHSACSAGPTCCTFAGFWRIVFTGTPAASSCASIASRSFGARNSSARPAAHQSAINQDFIIRLYDETRYRMRVQAVRHCTVRSIAQQQQIDLALQQWQSTLTAARSRCMAMGMWQSLSSGALETYRAVRPTRWM